MAIKMRKFMKYTGLFIAIILTLLLAVRAILNYSYGKKLESILADMRAKGDKLSFLEFEPKCETKDNGGLIWRGIEGLMYDQESPSGDVLNSALKTLFEEKAISAETRTKIQKLVLENRLLLQLLNEAAAKPCFKYQPEWSWLVPSISIRNMNLQPDRKSYLFELLGWQSLIATEKGDDSQGINQWISGMSLLMNLIAEPRLTTNFEGNNMLQRNLLFLRGMEALRKFPIPILRRIYEVLDAEKVRSSFLKAIDFEKTYSVDIYKTIVYSIHAHPSNFYKIPAWIFRPFLKAGAVWDLKMWDLAQKAARKNYTESHKDVDAYFKEIKNHPWYTYGINRALREFEFMTEAKTRTRIFVARLGIACEIYRAEHGHYPENLSQLPDELTKGTAIDPLSGKPLIYKRLESGFIIYSVGLNGKDDRGQETSWPSWKVYPGQNDDIVWKISSRSVLENP